MGRQVAAVIPGERSETRDPLMGAAGVWVCDAFHEGRQDEDGPVNGSRITFASLRFPG